MSLRYSFRHLFYGGKIQKERLYKVLEDLDTANTGDDSRLDDIETAIGKASGTGAGGILKDVKDIKDAIGTDDTTDGSLKKRCKSIETAIGDESTEGTILARIKALENAQPSQDTTQ